MSKTKHNAQWFAGYTAYCEGKSRAANPWSSVWGTRWAQGWKAAWNADHAIDAVELPSLKRA